MFEKPHNRGRRKASNDWNHGYRLQDDSTFDLDEDDIEAGRLVTLKGMTPETLPELESQTESEVW